MHADLHKIGGLPTLLSLLASPHPSLRWRAAEIAATCMANNPPVQRWFMEGGALPPLLALLADSHPVVVTKALLALSALVRHYEPGLEVRHSSSSVGFTGRQAGRNVGKLEHNAHAVRHKQQAHRKQNPGGC